MRRFDDTEWKLLADFLGERFGMAWEEARRGHLQDRLGARLAQLRLSSPTEYYHFLKFHPEAKEELAQVRVSITNNETYFFREAHQFEILARHVAPSVPADRPMRVLSAGCSSGEEVYSIAIHLQQAGLEGFGRAWSVEGCDLNPLRVAQARQAIYDPISLRACDASARERYFAREDDRWSLRPRYRKNTRFFEANLMEPASWWGLGTFDAIFCRNVLIYFAPTAFDQVISLFARLLAPGGWLFLGHSESLIDRRRDFEPVCLDEGVVYRRVEPA